MIPIRSRHPACPETLSAAQVFAFRTEGFLAFESVLSPEEVDMAREALSFLARDMHGKISSGDPDIECPPVHPLRNYAGHTFRRRGSPYFIQLEPAAQFETDATGFESKVRKFNSFKDRHPVFQSLARHPKIAGILQGLIGRDPILFQDMALVKPAFIGTRKPWHQDNAYFTVTPLDAVVGVWIALDDATAENGCMEVIPGGHAAGARRHFHGDDCEIVPGRIDPSKAVAVEIAAGGAMFFLGLLPHQTAANASAQRRRALQFHYRSKDSRILSDEDYNRVFAERDGSPASCAAAGSPR